MHHAATFGNGGANGVSVADVAFDEAEKVSVAVVKQGVEVVFDAFTAEIVEQKHRSTLFEERSSEVGSDKTGAAEDEDGIHD